MLLDDEVLKKLPREKKNIGNPRLLGTPQLFLPKSISNPLFCQIFFRFQQIIMVINGPGGRRLPPHGGLMIVMAEV